jgi:ferredoxin-NADP reductase
MGLPIGRRAAGVLRQLGRDLRMIAGGRAAPFAPRSGAPEGPDRTVPALLGSRRLVVREITRETSDAVTLHLVDGTGRPIPFAPGQFFTLLVPLPSGEVLRRAYSASAPHDPSDPSRASVTVKRISGGRASSRIVEHARPGDGFDVLGPSGSFTLDGRCRALVLVGGGSGITPLMAILRAALQGEPRARVALVYGNRTPADVIFAGALEALVAESGGRFALHHVFGAVMDRARLAAELDSLDVASDPEALFFLCGPEAMMVVARDVIAARGVPRARIREERFLSPQLRAANAAAARAGASSVTVRVGGVARTVPVAPGRTILEAGLAAGLPMPYSCGLGGCGACRVRVVHGGVEMEEPTCLSDAERATGYALTCVGRAREETVVEVER